jgi:DNA-binding CsgD family transcriptional regulator
MIGREAELARVERMLDDVPCGPGGVGWQGAPGIGKTTVWRYAVDAARERGYRVLSTTPAEPDAQLSFAALCDLLDGAVSDVLADLPHPQRRAIAAALLLEDASELPQDPGLLSRAVLSVIRELSAAEPLVLAIDDEQWLDRASARVLAFALCRLSDEPVSVLLARRSDRDTPLWLELAKGFGDAGLESATIAPFDDRTIESLIAERLGRPVSRRTLRRIHAVCGGNPFYALSIARELPEDQAAIDGEISIPQTLEDVMRRRLAHVDRRAQDALLVVAASSSPTLAVLDAVVPGFALSNLDSARRSEVIEVAGGRVRFTHPLLASAHYAGAPDFRRREFHRALAAVADDEEERARHLANGAEAPDEQIAHVLENAADGAARRGAPEAAAELLEQAAQLTPLDGIEARPLRLIDAALMHINAGDPARARHLLEELLPELGPGPLRARALHALAWTETHDYETQLEILDQGLAEAGDDDRLRVLIESTYCNGLTGRGRYREAADRAKAAVESARRLGDPGLLAPAVGHKAAGAFWTGEPVDFDELRQAIELEDFSELNTTALPSFVLGLILLRTDDLSAGRMALAYSLERATQRGEDLDATYALFHLVVLEWFLAGDHEEAARKFAVCVEERGRYIKDDIFFLWADSFFAAGRGDLEQARAKAEHSRQMCADVGNPGLLMNASMMLSQLDLWTGQAAAAHERMREARQAAVREGFGAIGFYTIGLWTLDIEALITLGRFDDAEAVLGDLTWRAQRAENPNAQAIAHRCRGLLLAAQGGIPEAIAEMDAALADHARRTLPPELARTLVEKGTLQRRAKKKSAAKQTLEEALAQLEPLDAEILKARARDELTRIGLRRAQVTVGLTAAQTRVAELVAAGMSNQEVANTLYMSTRSVESHLTKIYRELGIRSRSQLAAALAVEQSQPDTGNGTSRPA